MTIYRAIVITAALLAVAAVLGAPLWLLIPAGALVAVAVRIEELAPRPAHVRQTRNRPPCQCRACSTLEAQLDRERAIALATHRTIENLQRRSQLAAIRGWNAERYRRNPWLREVEMAHVAAALYVSLGRMMSIQAAWDEMAEDLGL